MLFRKGIIMEILTSEFIEFGSYMVGNDTYPMALVKQPYTIKHMTQTDLNNFNGDYIDLDTYTGEIVFKADFIY
jgi:hypothetical protein